MTSYSGILRGQAKNFLKRKQGKIDKSVRIKLIPTFSLAYPFPLHITKYPS